MVLHRGVYKKQSRISLFLPPVKPQPQISLFPSSLGVLKHYHCVVVVILILALIIADIHDCTIQ